MQGKDVIFLRFSVFHKFALQVYEKLKNLHPKGCGTINMQLTTKIALFSCKLQKLKEIENFLARYWNKLKN